MMLEILIEAAMSSCCLALLLGAVLTVWRVHNPHLQRTAWCGVLGAALVLPLLMWLARIQVVALPPITSRAVMDLGAVVTQGGLQRLSALLDGAAVQNAFNWQLQPALVNGKPTSAWGDFAVSFRLID